MKIKKSEKVFNFVDIYFKKLKEYGLWSKKLSEVNFKKAQADVSKWIKENE